jgi:hypothetical protein
LRRSSPRRRGGLMRWTRSGRPRPKRKSKPDTNR